ncbi:MAG: large conductance mechanosensitive channel protein MscL, partial [Oscillospiraceae bacterium]|nr:large conductance mechanosensitive channel protein MscL [Oscillospiraceae bacterium]
NVLDMAVGVVVGSAFTAIVNALVDNILMPLVGAIIAGVNFQDLGFHIPWGNNPYINIGAFLSAVITFLITAFCVFLIVKAFNAMRNFKKKEEEKKEEPAKVAPDIALLTEIRDLLKQQQK